MLPLAGKPKRIALDCWLALLAVSYLATNSGAPVYTSSSAASRPRFMYGLCPPLRKTT